MESSRDRKNRLAKERYSLNKTTIRERQRLYYLANPEKVITKSRAYARTVSGRTRQLVKAARDRAKIKNIEFSLTYEDIFPLLEKGVCQITGLPFVFESYSPFCSSIDRTDNSKGYTLDNIKVVIKAYNGAKGCGSHDDVLKMVRALGSI